MTTLFRDDDVVAEVGKLNVALNAVQGEMSLQFSQEGVCVPQSLMQTFAQMKGQLNTLNSHLLILAAFCEAVAPIIEDDSDVKERMMDFLQKNIVALEEARVKKDEEAKTPKIVGVNGRDLKS